jgi:hypothetical protein
MREEFFQLGCGEACGRNLTRGLENRRVTSHARVERATDRAGSSVPDPSIHLNISGAVKFSRLNRNFHFGFPCRNIIRPH